MPPPQKKIKALLLEGSSHLVSGYVIPMVSKSPNWGFPSKFPK